MVVVVFVGAPLVVAHQAAGAWRVQDEAYPLPSPFRGGAGGGVIPPVVPPASGLSDLSPRSGGGGRNRTEIHCGHHCVSANSEMNLYHFP